MLTKAVATMAIMLGRLSRQTVGKIGALSNGLGESMCTQISAVMAL
jgi:hypothetical protein